jgi:hypothetical protein
MASRMVHGLEEPLETGTFSIDGGYVKDLSADDRRALVREIQDKRTNSPRRSSLPNFCTSPTGEEL